MKPLVTTDPFELIQEHNRGQHDLEGYQDNRRICCLLCCQDLIMSLSNRNEELERLVTEYESAFK